MSRYLFGKACRLRKNFEFQRVREKGALLKGRVFSVCFMKNGLNCHRLGLSIGRSVVPLASGRSRIKRIIRETFRTNRDKISGGRFDMVFYIKRQWKGALDSETAKRDIIALMERAR